jgi:type IV secretion system protein VirD4
LNGSKWKKKLILCLPYIIVGLICTNFGEAWRLAEGVNASEKLQDIFQSGTVQTAFQNLFPSLYPTDLIVGIVCGAALRFAVYLKGKNAKKYRQGEEYGSARWGTHADIEPFEDPEFENNVILSQSERITMSSRPPVLKYARNKNILVVGGSGSGKTRFVLKPNLLQCCSKKYPVSFVITDPKGGIVCESAHALEVNGYEIRIFNTINFHKSMHYNPFAYIHDEKDILKLVTTLMANTKGEGNGGDPFWEKSEKLLYTALIGYIHYEAPVEEQNFATLLEMLNSMEVREDDETFKNPVDLLFDELEQKEPDHFAVRQFRKYKLAAGKTAKSILVSCGARLAPFDIKELREITAYDELELDTLGDRKVALFLIMSDTDSTFNFLISMIYTQMFNLLCEKADDVYGGRLPVHVRCLIDEMANIGQIPNLEKLMATIRSREISAVLVLQAKSQLKSIYNREEGIHQIREQLAQGELSGIQESIRQDLAELEGSEDELRQTAEALLVRLDALQKESKEEIAADGKTSPVPEEIEKQLTKNQTGKMEKKRETEKTGSGQQERASVLQRLSSGKERAEKSPERSRKPREKSPER